MCVCVLTDAKMCAVIHKNQKPNICLTTFFCIKPCGEIQRNPRNTWYMSSLYILIDQVNKLETLLIIKLLIRSNHGVC